MSTPCTPGQVPDGIRLQFTELSVPACNGVMVNAVDQPPAQVEQAVDMYLEEARRTGPAVPWSIRTRNEPDPDIVKTAERHGLRSRTSLPFMVLELEEQKSPGGQAPLTVRTVTVEGEDVDTYLSVFAEVNEIPPNLLPLICDRNAMRDPRVALYLGEVDGVPVATSMGVLDGHLIGMYDVSTLAAHRRQGHGRRITDHVLVEAFAAGARVAYLRPSDEGLPLYSAMGFQTVEEWILPRDRVTA